MSISLEAAKQILQSQPFSKLVGAELVRFSENMVELRVPITEQLKQQYGFVHGGVISYAADNALTFAGGYALGSSVVTAEFKINYVRPAIGDALIARASVVHAGATQAVPLRRFQPGGTRGNPVCGGARHHRCDQSPQRRLMPAAGKRGAGRRDRPPACSRRSGVLPHAPAHRPGALSAAGFR